MAAPATAPTPAPTVPVGLAQPRVIPGFKTAAVNAPKPARSRSKKSKVPATTTAAGQDAEEEATVVVVSETVEAGEEDYEIVDEVEEKKLTSSVEAVQKRIRAASKKLVSCPFVSSGYSLCYLLGSGTCWTAFVRGRGWSLSS